MSTSGALSSAALQRKHLFFFHQKKWHHSEETGSTWNHRYLSKALLNLQIIADLCAQTEPWLFICQYLVVVFSPPHHFSVITASLTVKAWIFSIKEIFLIVTTRKIQTVLLKIDGVDFPWKSEQLWMQEGSSAFLWSISDGQMLFGKRKSCYKPHGVDPSSLGKQSAPKNKLP